MEDIRWQQRLGNFSKALSQLNNAVRLSKEKMLNDLEKQGLIQSFEFTHELAWKLMKDYFVFQGNTQIMGSRDATREAFSTGLIEEGQIWMDMILSRNKTSHTYDEETASEIMNKILDEYVGPLNELEYKMLSLKKENQ